MKYADGVVIVLVSLGAAVFCEALSWLLIYRTAPYKSLMASITKASRKVESMRASGSGGNLNSSGGGTSSAGSGGSNKSRNKKIDRFELSLKESNQSLSVIKFQSGAVVGLTLILVFGFLNSIYDGKVVAKLPFEPYPFFQKMTHRNLPGTDVTDCALAFLYMICSMSIRPNLQKLLGFSPPRSSNPAGPFGLPLDPRAK